MKTGILACSIALAALPVWAQQAGTDVRKVLPTAASHAPATATPPAAAPANGRDRTLPKVNLPPRPKPVEKPKPVEAAAPVAEKPAAPKVTASAESAAERIMRRLDEEFPKRPAGSAFTDARPAPNAERQRPVAGTDPAPHASNRLTLSWRITLRWPEQIAPVQQVK